MLKCVKEPQPCVVCGYKKYYGEFWHSPDGKSTGFVCSVCWYDIASDDGAAGYNFPWDKKEKEPTAAKKEEEGGGGTDGSGGAGAK